MFEINFIDILLFLEYRLKWMNLFILKGYWVFFDIIILIISLFFLMYIIFLLGV